GGASPSPISAHFRAGAASSWAVTWRTCWTDAAPWRWGPTGAWCSGRARLKHDRNSRLPVEHGPGQRQRHFSRARDPAQVDAQQVGRGGGVGDPELAVGRGGRALVRNVAL